MINYILIKMGKIKEYYINLNYNQNNLKANNNIIR